GRRTVEAFRPYLEDADAVFVKGSPGVFEDPTFRYGTERLLDAVTHAGFSVVGGGDTARAVDLCGLDEGMFDHVSIAGGAYIRALTGEELPAVRALKEHG
ncbi:MAG: phosphoglycerate kinase, partial [Candidatus Nanohaloarchaea archaeon]